MSSEVQERLRAAAAELHRVRETSLWAEVVRQLDVIDGSDPGGNHSDADELLLAAVPAEVREAYMRLIGRCRWWATA